MTPSAPTWRRAALALVCCAWMVCVGPVRAAPAQPLADDLVLEARVNALAAELRCLVCQNQSLADSHAELALQLKGQVREQLRAGRSEREVIDYLTTRYGDFVLYRPPLSARTALLWGGPAGLALAGLGGLAWRLRRRVEPPPLSDRDLTRARSLLGD